jgi:hypothetical protein
MRGMISRIPLRCLACREAITFRVQVGHERLQRVSAVCPHCFTPIRLRLSLENPPRVGVGFEENCEPSREEGTVLNVGSGFVISRSRMHEDQYFPVMDMSLDEDVHRAIEALPQGGGGQVQVDLTVLLGGLPYATEHWRALRTAYRFSRTGQAQRAREKLRELFGEDDPENDIAVEGAIISFFVRFLEPNGKSDLRRALGALMRSRETNPIEFDRLVAEFRADRWERMDEYIDVLDHFFRAYDEFNQTLMYVRRGANLPDDPYAPSTDFENTKLYYGEAFEVLGSHIDILAAVNNIQSGRQFDQLSRISLRQYRTSDKGRRNEAIAGNADLSLLISEYDNRLRNASHHRWLRLSHDRSQITYCDGGNGTLRSLSYAEYLYRCCAITAQLMLLAATEAAMFSMPEAN